MMKNVITKMCAVLMLFLYGCGASEERERAAGQREPVAGLTPGGCQLKTYFSDDTNAVKGVNILKDDNFIYVIGDRNDRKLIRLNSKATAYDLYNFVRTVCWGRRLQAVITENKVIREEDAELLRFCITAYQYTIAVLINTVVVDMLEATIDDTQKPAGIAEDMAIRFMNDESGLRRAIRSWAKMHGRYYVGKILAVFEDVKKGSGAVKDRREFIQAALTAASRILEAGQEGDDAEAKALTICISKVLQDVFPIIQVPIQIKNESLFEGIIESSKVREGKPYNNGSVLGTDLPGNYVGDRWLISRRQISLIANELTNVMKVINDTRKSEMEDPKTQKYLDDIAGETGEASAHLLRMLDYIVYDVPFCLLAYDTLNRLNACKGKWYSADNEKKMREVVADWASAICGTEMLIGIRTRYAASCYTGVVNFLKSELGWFTQDSFKEFANEMKLYKVVIGIDEEGRAANKIEKWDTDKSKSN